MKITTIQDLTATLPADREKIIIVDGSGSLILSRNKYAIEFSKKATGVLLKNFTVYRPAQQKYRLKRFLHFIKIAWAFSK